MKKIAFVLVLLFASIVSTSAMAQAQTIWYGWDQNLGLVEYDADTGAKNDLPGPGLYNMSLGINPVNGEMWGFTDNNIYSIDKATGQFVLEHTIGFRGEASSFDLAGNFLVSEHGGTLYQVDLVTGVTTLTQSLPMNPDGFDILPDGRWVANDSGTIFILDSAWNIISQWSGPASETIAADENGRVFGSNGNDLHEIDIVNQTSTLLWTDNGALAIYGSEAFSGGITPAPPPSFPATPIPSLGVWAMLLLVGSLLLLGFGGLNRRQGL